jgi:hypothetical protein
MPKTYNAKVVKDLGEVTTANHGEMIIFGLGFAAPEGAPPSEEHFTMPYDSLSLFIARLMDGGSKANAQRQKAAIHANADDMDGFSCRLENGAIGPSALHKGEHILECQVQGAGAGSLKYRIRADREGLETLHSLIGWYLDTPAGRGETSHPAH